jgi:hypothetical protein
MIYNKSGHPIEVKKISVRLWTLRDEIEAAIGRRMKECEAAGIPLFIDDIKRFYNLNLQSSLNDQSNVLQLHNKTDDAESMANLMESLNEEEVATPEPEIPTAHIDGEAAPAPDSQTFNQAEELIAEQSKQGLETKKPSPILERPYQRQPPDLDKISYGFTLLSDINMESILSFNKDKFLQGQSVVVEFLIPQTFMMTATVTYCHFYALRSRIISSTKPDYRLQCRFSFSILGERETLRSFLKSIEPTLPHGQKKMKKDNEDDSLGI